MTRWKIIKLDVKLSAQKIVKLSTKPSARKIIKFTALVCAILSLSLFSGCVSSEKAPKDNFSKIVKRTDEKNHLTMYFIDLDVPEGSKDKSGDSTLLVSPDGKTMLIDCGHPDAGKDVVRTLQALGISSIDIFVNSHPHIDHLGAFPQISATFSIGIVYRSHFDYSSSRYYREFEEAIAQHSIRAEYLSDGDSFMFGDAVTVDVFHPNEVIEYPKNFPENGTQFINNNSIAMLFTFGESKALFCGDLYRGGERDVLNKYENQLDCDVAKANHHGADTSSQLAWIRATTPQVVVAMNDVVGSMDVVNNYVKYGATFYHTLLNGTVKVQMDDAQHVNVLPQFASWIENVVQEK